MSKPTKKSFQTISPLCSLEDWYVTWRIIPFLPFGRGPTTRSLGDLLKSPWANENSRISVDLSWDLILQVGGCIDSHPYKSWLNEPENGFMEPKYYAFRMWLDIPSIIWEYDWMPRAWWWDPIPSGPASNGTSSTFSGGAFPNIAGVYVGASQWPDSVDFWGIFCQKYYLGDEIYILQFIYL